MRHTTSGALTSLNSESCMCASGPFVRDSSLLAHLFLDWQHATVYAQVKERHRRQHSEVYQEPVELVSLLWVDQSNEAMITKSAFNRLAYINSCVGCLHDNRRAKMTI